MHISLLSFACLFSSLMSQGNNKQFPSFGKRKEAGRRTNESGQAGTPHIRSHIGCTYAEDWEGYIDAPLSPNWRNPRAISNIVGKHFNGMEESPIFINHYVVFLDYGLGIPTIVYEGDPAEANSPNKKWHQTQFQSFQTNLSPGTGSGTGKPRTTANLDSVWIDFGGLYADGYWDKTTGKVFVKKYVEEGHPVLSLINNYNETFGVDAVSWIAPNHSPGAGAFNQLFSMEHNRLVDELSANNPTWDAETLFQEARRLVIAFIQNIAVREYLAALVGEPLPPYTGYNDTLDPSADLFFTAVSMRYGHSAIADKYRLLDNNLKSCPMGAIATGDAPYAPSHWRSPHPTNESQTIFDVPSMLRGMSNSPGGDVDLGIVEGLRNWRTAWEGTPQFFFVDLTVSNLVRGRELGIPPYGLPRVTSFAEISSNKQVQMALEKAYGSVDEIEAFIGGIAEEHVPNGEVGPLFKASLLDQFRRIRDADRFWFENEDQFTTEEIEMIHGTKLKDIFLRNFPEIIDKVLPTSPFYLAQRQLFFSDGVIFPEPLAHPDGLPWSDKVDLSPSYAMYWAIDREVTPNIITVQLIAYTEGWVGIGFVPDQKNTMKGADIVLCRTNSDNDPECLDYKALDVGVPYLDTEHGGTNDVKLLDFTRSGGFVTAMFSRPVTATDSLDKPIGDNTRIIFAYNGETNELAYHGPTRQSTLVINFQADYLGPPVKVDFSQGVKIFLYILAAIGIVHSLALIFLIRFKIEYFYLQTPEFCVVVFVGALMGYISIILILPDNQTDSMCWASIWLFGMSFWFVFVGFFVKIARIYVIVRAARTLEFITVPLWQLFVPLVCCILGEALFNGLWNGLIPPDLEKEFNDDNTYYEYCAGNRYMWLGSVVFRAVFLGFGVFLSLGTKDYQKQFNWSKEIAVSLYTLAIILIILIPLGFAISQTANMVVLLKGIGIFIAYFTVTNIMVSDSLKRMGKGKEPLTMTSGTSKTGNSRSSKA